MSSTAITLFTILAILLIVAGVSALLLKRRRTQGASASGYQVQSSRSPEDELSALGILDIRPKGATPAVASDLQEDVAPADDDILEAVIIDDVDEKGGEEHTFEAGEDEQVDSEGEVDDEREEKDAEEPTSGSNRGGVSRREALFRLMNAVQASVDGYTACLIKRGIDGRCHVEAFVSQHPQSLNDDSFALDTFFQDSKVLESAVTVIEVGTADVPMSTLTYYREPVSVRQLAIAPVKGTDSIATYFLVVDALAWQDLDDPWQRLMIGQFATLMGTFLSTPISQDDSGEFVRPRIRPRREIIAEEIENARGQSYPLALALIYLNSAEDVSKTGEKAVVDAERIMADRLTNAVNGGRMERFGELTYGVFFTDDVSEVEAWALQLQEELVREGHYFENGVSIGIALLQERHENADHFRADATEALREAFETGACTIIE